MKLLCTKSVCEGFVEGELYNVVAIDACHPTTLYDVWDEDVAVRSVPLEGLLWEFNVVVE